MKIITTLMMGFGLLGLAACGEAPEIVAPVQEHALPLGAATLEMEDWIRLPGEVVSLNQVVLSSKISARIRNIHVREGEQIRAGQLLVTLDNTDIEAGVRSARATRSTAQALLEDAERDYRRLAELHAKGVVTRQELEKAVMRLALEKNQLALAEAQLDSALALRQDTELRSPFNGMLLSLERKVGDLVVPGLSLAQLLSEEKRFEVQLSPLQVGVLQRGQAAKIYLSRDGEARPAQLDNLVESSGVGGRSFKAQLTFDDVEGVPSGLVGFAYFPVGKSDNPWVPETALVERGGLKGVFVISPQHTASFRWLRLGRARDGHVEVLSGLSAQDILVLGGAAAVRQGDIVRASRG